MVKSNVGVAMWKNSCMVVAARCVGDSSSNPGTPPNISLFEGFICGSNRWFAEFISQFRVGYLFKNLVGPIVDVTSDVDGANSWNALYSFSQGENCWFEYLCYYL